MLSFLPPWKNHSHRRLLGYVLGLNVLTWMIARGITDTNLDSYGDMLENFAWGQSIDWGSAKHPPLFAWITGSWFALFPNTDNAYRLLSYLNVTVGLAGVYRIAQAWRRPDLALPAVLLLCMAFPYSTLAAKFNANAVLLSLWPWVALAWLRSLQLSGRQGMIWSLALGGLSALAMLGKYYSGVFLLGILLSTLATKDGRFWLLTRRPWLALVVFFLCLTPHLAWLNANEFVTLRYVGEQSTSSTGAWKHVLKFALAPIAYWLLPWMVCAWIYSSKSGGVRQKMSAWSSALLRSWMPRGWDDGLFWMAMSPWAITLIFGISGFVELSLPWAIPIGFGFSLLWLRNLTASHAETKAQTWNLLKVVLGWFALVLVASPLYAWHLANSGAAIYYLPRSEVAKELLQTWHTRHPNQALQWVGGHWAENAALSFYGDDRIRVVHGVPDQFPATINSLPEWEKQAGILFCPLGQAGKNVTTACPQNMKAWLSSHGQFNEPIFLTTRKEGLRFPLNRPFEYLVYEYLPK